MQEAICIIGIQASGKTTTANYYKDLGYTVIASDDIRRAHPGISSLDVFVIFYQELVEALMYGKNVVCEATNLTFKARQFFFEAIRKTHLEVKKIALIVNTSIDQCKKNLENRNNSSYDMKFGPEVIDRYVASFQMPTYKEGFDEIRLLREGHIDSERLMKALSFKHNDRWHGKETVQEHCDNILKLYNDRNDKTVFSDTEFELVTKWHDFGKHLTATQNLKLPEFLTYQNHGPVGAWELASMLSTNDLATFYVPLVITSYHMSVCEMKQKTLDKRFTKEEQDKLLFFESLDKASTEGSKLDN